jgi:hypothetical protein
MAKLRVHCFAMGRGPRSRRHGPDRDDLAICGQGSGERALALRSLAGLRSIETVGGAEKTLRDRAWLARKV